MKTLARPIFVCLLTVAAYLPASAQLIYQLQPLPGFGVHGDGSVRPGEVVFDSASNQRGMAFDPVLTNLVIVDTHTGAGGSDHGVGNIFVLSGLTGQTLDDGSGGDFKLNTNGMPNVQVNQSYPYAAAAVAADGVVYVCNQPNGSLTTPFLIYRWPSSTNLDPPVICFSNYLTAPSLRYGTSIAIRGGGTNTQILVGALTGTNVTLFTTSDGTNFIANQLNSDSFTSAFDDGLAFGAGNTFWAKQVSQGIYSALSVFSFNIAAKTATTIKSFPASIFPDNDNLGPIAVSTNLNLLVALEEVGGNISSGADRVRLYDISNFSNQPPALLDVKTFTPDNANTIAPMGYINFVGTNVYVQNINNGMLAFGVGLASPPPPTLTVVPASTNQAVVGRTVNLTVAGFPAISFQWQSNGVNIANATNGTLSLVNIQNSYNQALFNCVVTNSSGTTNANSRIVIVTAANFYHLALQWNAYPVSGGAPDSPNHPYIFNGNGASASTPNLRSIAYNALSNHLYAIVRGGNAVSNYDFYVIDAATGNSLYTMKTNGITLGVGNGGIGLASVAVADDGAIYACNVAPQAGGGSPYDNLRIFRLYRWADGNSNTLPVQIYTNDPAINASMAGATAINRWGDSLAVRGSGTNTQLILDNNNTDVRYVTILSPSDNTMTNWTTSGLHQTITGSGIGRSLEFGSSSLARSGTFWQKRNSTALIQSPYDLDAPIDPPPATLKSTAFTNALSGGTVDSTRHLLLGVSTYPNAVITPDTLDLYEVSDFNSPLLLAQYNFPVNFGTNHNGNAANFINKTIRSGDKVFSLDAGNGLMAFTIAPGAPTAPLFLAQPQDVRVIQGGTASFGVSVDQQAAFQWRFSGANISGATGQSYSFTNAQSGNAGSYTVVASNLFGVTTSAVATVTVVLPQDEYSLSQLWNIPPTNGNGNIIIGNGGGAPNTRTIAYNALSNHLYVVSRTGTTTSNYVVYVLNAADGSLVSVLNTNGLYNAGAVGEGGVGLAGIGVADDGSIYACNIALDACACSGSALSGTNGPAADSLFRVYRWSSEDTNFGPIQVFSGDPSAASSPIRWGDTLTVRGGGTNTEILVDSTTGVAAVLKPTDQYLTNFTSSSFTITAQSTGIGRSLQFGSTNTLWQKRTGTALRLSRYDLVGHTSTTVASYGNFGASVGPVGLDLTRNLMASIDFIGSATTPDAAGLWDIANPNSPLLVAEYSFGVSEKANDNQIGQAVFAGNRVWALDANNGLTAFSIGGPQLSVAASGNTEVVSWTTNGSLTLQATPSLSPPITWTNAGAGNVFGIQYFSTNSSPAGSMFYRLSK